MILAKMFAIHYGVWFLLMLLFIEPKNVKSWKDFAEFIAVTIIASTSTLAIHWGLT